jgi:hypothetical protein
MLARSRGTTKLLLHLSTSKNFDVKAVVVGRYEFRWPVFALPPGIDWGMFFGITSNKEIALVAKDSWQYGSRVRAFVEAHRSPAVVAVEPGTMAVRQLADV